MKHLGYLWRTPAVLTAPDGRTWECDLWGEATQEMVEWRLGGYELGFDYPPASGVIPGLISLELTGAMPTAPGDFIGLDEVEAAFLGVTCKLRPFSWKDGYGRGLEFQAVAFDAEAVMPLLRR